MKKMTMQNLKEFRDGLHLPIPDSALEADLYQPPYYNPGPESEEIKYLKDRRARLGGYVPERRVVPKPLVLPGDKVYDVLTRGSGKQEIATTMAFVRLVRDLFKDPEIGKRVVPIIPDEARTFGMDSFFPTAEDLQPVRASCTPRSTPISMLAYKESEQGVILHEGIDEAGSVATLTAVSTSYATHGEPMIPMYIFYSMFGFQRTGDGIWAIGDQMGRGFVLGATAGPHHADRRGSAARRRAFAPAGLDACRMWWPTTRPTATRSRTSSRTACAGCTAAARNGRTARTSSTTSRCTTSRTSSRSSRTDLDVDGLLKGIYKLSPAADGGRQGAGPAARLRASVCGGHWRPSTCSARTGTSPPTSGR